MPEHGAVVPWLGFILSAETLVRTSGIQLRPPKGSSLGLILYTWSKGKTEIRVPLKRIPQAYL